MKIRLVTERTDASIGLRLAGVDTVCARDSKSIRQNLESAATDADVGVLLITPGVEKLCPDTVEEIRLKGRPLLVCIPDSDGRQESTDVIGEYIHNAIGIKID